MPDVRWCILFTVSTSHNSHTSFSFRVSPSVIKGEFSIPLRQVTNLAPIAQVVVYTVMPSGEAVADSKDFPIQLCLNNKVQARSPISNVSFLIYS